MCSQSTVPTPVITRSRAGLHVHLHDATQQGVWEYAYAMGDGEGGENGSRGG